MNTVRQICCFCEKWGSGGIESFLLNTWEHMNRQELNIHVITAQVDSQLYLPRLQACGVTLTVLSGSTKRLWCNHRLFKKLLNNHPFDVIHLNAYHGLTLWYLRAAEKAGIPVRIAHAHGTALRKSKTRVLKMILHTIGKSLWGENATLCLACSEGAARFQFSKNQTVAVLHNGIDLNRFAFSWQIRNNMRSILKLDDQLVIGTVGRLESEKNHGFLLQVFTILQEMQPNSILLIAGQGPDLADLQALAEKLGVIDRVCFLGPRQDIPQLLCAMDVFVLPSLFEGLGISVIEAQANGLAVVCSQGVPEEAVVSSHAIRLDLHEGPMVWAKTILSCASLPRNNCRHALTQAAFDVEQTAGKLEQIYRNGEIH